jgi:excisionase family DNA binding protein
VKTGTQFYTFLVPCLRRDAAWIPAFAGMTLCLVNYGLLSNFALLILQFALIQTMARPVRLERTACGFEDGTKSIIRQESESGKIFKSYHKMDFLQGKTKSSINRPKSGGQVTGSPAWAFVIDTKETEMEMRMLRVKEVAKRLNVSETWVYRKAQCRIMPHVRLGNSVRFIESDLEIWINASKVKGCLTIERRPGR